MLNLFDVDKTIKEVMQSLAAIQEMQTELMEQIADIKQMIVIYEKEKSNGK